MSLATLAAIAGVVVAVGGAWVVLLKVVRAMRRFARFLDGWFGDGTVKHPSVLDRLGTMETNQTQTTTDLAAVKAQTASIERKLDEHVDTVAPGLLADGQAWGHRLDEQVADNTQRIEQLENRTSGTDPVVASK